MRRSFPKRRAPLRPCSWLSAAAIGALACGTPPPAARAAVIYSGARNIPIPASFDGVYLDIVGGNTSGAEFSGWDANFVFGGSGIGNSPEFQPVRTGTAVLSSVRNLGAGALVDQYNTYSAAGGYGGSEDHLGNGAGQFGVGQEGYLGFSAVVNGATRYGWMRVILTNNASGAFILDWAYDDTGATVVTGDAIGPSDLVKNDGGTLTLSHAHTYGGLTTVNAGTLELTGNGRPGTGDGAAASGTEIMDAGLLLLSGVEVANELLTFSGNGSLRATGTNRWGGAVTLGTSTVIDVQNGVTSFSGAVSGGGFEKRGAGTLLLTAVNTYAGPIRLSEGIVLMGAGNILPDSSAMTLSGGRWNTGGHSDLTGSLSMTSSSIIDMGAAVSILTFNSINPGNDWNGDLSVWNWTDGVDRLIFGGGSLSPADLARIRFYSDGGVTPVGSGAGFTPGGELVPVPEPVGLLPGAALMWIFRRRREPVP